MRRSTTVCLLAWLLLRQAPASAQLAEAECGSSWPGFPFPEERYLERARQDGLDLAWREFAAHDALHAGHPAAPAPGGGTPAWIWHSDLAAIAGSSDLGVFISRFNQAPRTWARGVTEGFIISGWAFVAKGTRTLIADAWLFEKNDQRPLRPECGIRFIAVPWGSAAPISRAPDYHDVAAAVPPPAALRDADNAMIAHATCRSRWPPIIAAAGEDHGLFLLPGVGEIMGGANLRSILDHLPDEPVRWRRVRFLASRDGKLGLSIGRLVNCDDPKVMQTYVSAWVRDGTLWRLELLAIVP